MEEQGRGGRVENDAVEGRLSGKRRSLWIVRFTIY